MSTPAVVPVAAPSKLQNILGIINLSLQGLQLAPVIGPGAAVADTFLNILMNALAVHQQETGQPFDLSKIPIEQLVPPDPTVVPNPVTPIGPIITTTT